MVKKKTNTNNATAAPAVSLKQPKPKKARPKAKRSPRLSAEKLRELMVKNKPPQSWYDEDHEGLY